MTADLRPASPADVPVLLPMMRELYDFDHSPFNEAEHRRGLLELIANERFGRVWLISSGGQPAGYVILVFSYSLEFRGRDATLDELYIAPAFRGRGLGRAALQFAEDAARAAGVQAVHLLVTHSNTRAREIYRKSGYVEHDRAIMTKWLSRPDTP